MANARDYECPICMMLMIEPVLLPCKHELCYKCFILSYTNTSDQCPFCRMRIATWARKAMRNNRVINTAKWDVIKKLFPEKVKCILEGRDIISDEEETEMQIISEDGTLGKEYMVELEKIESERLQASQVEEAASLALIEKLCQAEGQLFMLPSVKVDSTSGSSDVTAATVMPTGWTYSTIDVERLKQIKEEEEASLRLIKQLQKEEAQAMRERQKREELDRQFARMIASTLNKPMPTEPVIDPSDCVIYPSSPCASFPPVFCVDAPSCTSLSSSGSSSASGSSTSSGSSSASCSLFASGSAASSGSSTSSGSSYSSGSSASASVLPTTPSTSSDELSSLLTHMSAEIADKVVAPSSSLRKCETNVKGKKAATRTPLFKWLYPSLLSEAALGSSSESGMTVLDLQTATTALHAPFETNPPTQVTGNSPGTAGELPTELLHTASGPNATDNTSQQDDFLVVSAAVALPDLVNWEQNQTDFVLPASEEIAQDVVTSEVGQVLGIGAREVVSEVGGPRNEATTESNSIGIGNEGALSYSGQPNEIPATDIAKQFCFSQNLDSLPTASGSRIEEPEQQGVEHRVTGDAICNATGMLGKPPTSDSPLRISVASARARRSRRADTPAKKSLKRSIVYLNEDPEPCCSTSSVSQTSKRSLSPNGSCCSAEKKMCLHWSEMSKPMHVQKISHKSDVFEDAPSLTRSDFNSEESYRLYLEEQDHQFALRLQRTFDLESKSRNIPRREESGGYNLRGKGRLPANGPEELIE